jgi:hypothetical protein
MQSFLSFRDPLNFHHMDRVFDAGDSVPIKIGLTVVIFMGWQHSLSRTLK